jgi:hypothetical protein
MPRLLSLALLLALATPAPAAEPRLIVVVSVDQLCQEYFHRFSGNIRANDGIYAYAQANGAIYSNCHHAHAFTITAPGHAVQMTGAYPQQHGIIGNEWWDRDLKKPMYCVTDLKTTTIGAAVGDGPCSPRNLLVPTVGDVLKMATNKKAKVFGVSLKDRAAILMTGALADAAYWYEETEGVWATSSYYRKDLPGYIRAFNESKFADRYAGQEWTLSLDQAKYRHHTPDDFASETNPDKLGKTFPHKLEATAGKPLWLQLRYTPFGNEMTLAVAKEVVINEQLGQDDIPDILCVNFSSNDYVGHAFGPHSLEVEDITYRTDRLLREFYQFLSEQKGIGDFVMAITADHGICPLPEYIKEQGIRRAGRDPLGGEAKVKAQLEPLLRDKLKLKDVDEKQILVERVESQQLFLARDHKALAGDNYAKAQRICRDWILENSAIHTAATREDLLLGRGGGEFNAALLKTFHARRSGDVLWIYEPYYLCGTTGTTHGSPWFYDTHVPMILIGPGIEHGLFTRRVSPAMLAPTVSHILGLDPPAACVEEPLREALGVK